jgi:C4-dicarboxylate-specific signal transduction histidine kinase
VAQEVRRRGVSIGGAESGHGIGLAIVDDIIRIYGGTLEVITGTLGGALMKVHLPNR